MTTTSYGEKAVWAPKRPRIGLLHVVVAVGPLDDRPPRRRLDRPRRAHRELRGRVRCGGRDRDPQRAAAAGDRGAAAAADARHGPPARPDPRCADAPRRRQHHRRRPVDRLVLVGSRRRARRVGGLGRPRRRLRDERRRRLHAAGDPTDREAIGRARRNGRPGHHLPRDRRPRAARAAARDARRQRAQHGPLARRGRLHADGVGDGPLLADGRLAGRHPARLERGHPRLPLGREGDGDDDGLLGAARLRRDRASPCGSWPAARRRREPRQPALRRGRPLHPHGQPDGGGEEGEPRATGRSSPTAST